MGTRIRTLKEESALTWDQIRRLFGVSLRTVHAWALGGHMGRRDAGRLAVLESVIRDLATTPSRRRQALLRPPIGGGRSIFQQLVSGARRSANTGTGCRMKMTGVGFTIRGDFLSAEDICDVEGAAIQGSASRRIPDHQPI